MMRCNAEGFLISGELAPCDACGKPTDMYLLDGKDDGTGTGNFNRLECRECYGEGWAPVAVAMRWKEPEIA